MKSEQTIPVKLLWFGCWLLFLPNAPYLITDLVHLEPRPSVPYYFDLVLLFSAAWNGLLLGLLSFQQIERQLNLHFARWKVNSIVFVLFLLCGFGIYLGRFDRYNSWHIITQPFDLAADIIRYMLQPLQHLHTWAVTVLFGAALWLMYQTMRQLQSVSQR